ncbi:MAG: tetratricopeptide repeat protein, partial [Nostoc sp.]
PRQWAMTHLNLGNVFLEQEQIEAAITCYRSALKIFTPTAFPNECLKAGQMLGNTAFNPHSALHFVVLILILKASMKLT